MKPDFKMSVFKRKSTQQLNSKASQEDSSENDTSETSVNSSDDESSDDSDNDEEVEEETATRRSTRISEATLAENPKSKGRVTRQKTKEQVPAKRFLRTRKTSPAAGSGKKKPQVFPCPNCKKEFNNSSSVNKHIRWCKPKPVNRSPKKKKDESKPEVKQANQPLEVQPPTPATPDKPRGRGRPRKNPVTSPSVPNHEPPSIQQTFHETLERRYVENRSPQSSPGGLDTSSESDYEQREFAANVHLTLRHSNMSIDVVNPDPPDFQSVNTSEQCTTEGPVTCPQCKMTYRTIQGYHNHAASCVPYGSSSDEDEEEVDVQNITEHNVTQTYPTQSSEMYTSSVQNLDETRIPPLSQTEDKMEIDSDTTSSSSSSEDNDEPQVSLDFPPHESATNVPVPNNDSKSPSVEIIQINASVPVVENNTNIVENHTRSVSESQEPKMNGLSSACVATNVENKPQISPGRKSHTIKRPKPSPPKSRKTPDTYLQNAARITGEIANRVGISDQNDVVTSNNEQNDSDHLSSNSEVVPSTEVAFGHNESPVAHIPHQYIPPPSSSQVPTFSAPVQPNSTNIFSVPPSILQHGTQNTSTYTQAQIMPTVVNSAGMQMQQLSASSYQPVSSQTISYSNFPQVAFSSPQTGLRVQNSVQSGSVPVPHPISHLVNSSPQQPIQVGQMYRNTDQRMPTLQQETTPQPFQQYPQTLSTSLPTSFQPAGQQVPTSSQIPQFPFGNGSNLLPYGINVQNAPMTLPIQQQQQVGMQLQHQVAQQVSQDLPQIQQFRPQLMPMSSQVGPERQQNPMSVQPISQSMEHVPIAGNHIQQNLNPQFPTHPHQQLHYSYFQNQAQFGKLPEAIATSPQLPNVHNSNLLNGSHQVPYQMQLPQNSQMPPQPIMYQQNPSQPQPAAMQNVMHGHPFNPSFQVQNDNQMNSVMPHSVGSAGVAPNMQQQPQIQQQFFAGQHNMALQQQLQLQLGQDPTRSQHPNLQQSLNPALWNKTGNPIQQNGQAPSTDPNSQQCQVNHPMSLGQQPIAQPQVTQVIQQIAQLPDGSTMIYLVPAQTPSASLTQNGLVANNPNFPQGNLLNLVSGLQSLPTQHQQSQLTQQQPQISPQIPKAAPCAVASKTTPTQSNGTVSTGRSAPCPCPACKEKLSTANAMEKFKKVLPYPSADQVKTKPNASSSPTLRPIMIRPGKPQKQIRMQKGVALVTNQNGTESSTSPGIEQTQLSLNNGSVRILPLVKPIQPPTTVGAVGDNRASISTPNIAVVRPMENPLQRLSDQITQLESSFMSTQNHQPVQTSIPQGPQLTLLTISPPPMLSDVESNANSVSESTEREYIIPANTVVEHNLQSIEEQQITSVMEISEPGLANLTQAYQSPQPRLVLVNHSTPSVSNGVTMLSSPVKAVVKNGTVAGVKRKLPASADNSIKVTLRRKEGGDSYSINRITGSTSKNNGTMKSLKIKGQIKSGEQAGTSTDVIVVPTIHTVPIPDPNGSEMDLNRTIAEDDSTRTTHSETAPGSNLRLTHKAVIVYEVRSNETVLFRSSDVRAVWGYIFETVQGRRINHNLPPLAYPATNISLSQCDQETEANFSKLGLTHRAVQFLLEQLPGMKALSSDFKFVKIHPSNSTEDEPIQENESGCARTERFIGRKQFDMFGWLASKHRKAPVPVTHFKSTDSFKSLNTPLVMRYRKLKEKANANLVVWWSTIHGRGLYTNRDVEKGEMVIEYAGEVIRPMVCEMREKYYESKSIGCYMFRINDRVIDATMKGNAARFINHSCDPNCETRTVKILGKHHILIFAIRKIQRNEELTYDYKFEKEEEKIPCTCSSTNCRKYLN